MIACGCWSSQKEFSGKTRPARTGQDGHVGAVDRRLGLVVADVVYRGYADLFIILSLLFTDYWLVTSILLFAFSKSCVSFESNVKLMQTLEWFFLYSC